MRLKTLNGAPLAAQLAFDEDVLLARGQCTPFSALPPSGRTDAGSDSDTGIWTWRRLDSTQAHASPSPDQDIACHATTPPTADDFLQHSLIFHDTLLSSQVALAQHTTADQTISSSSFLTTSFGTSTSGPSSPLAPDRQRSELQLPPTLALTTIAAIPSAQHLRSIYPQTPTPNIMCVLMTNPERRDIFVRKGGYRMDLYEIIVADDTKSGFKISFWLRPPREPCFEQASPQQHMLRSLERMRVGDIVLLRNIALASFRDTVYGQSLNPQISRARTTIDVLVRSSGIAVGQLGDLPAPILAALTRLKRWSRSCVAVPEIKPKRGRSASATSGKPGKRQFVSSSYGETLPPDTLEPE